MKYRGYKDKRSYHNAKIHAMAHIVYSEGAKECLSNAVKTIVSDRPFKEKILQPSKSNEGWSISSLTDREAEELYNDLLAVCKRVKANMKQTKQILDYKDGMMTDRQRRKLIRITRYKFRWGAEVTFSKIVEYCPELTKKLTTWQIKQTKLFPLFNLITNEQADKIIKRLEKIEERNKDNE